MATTVKKTAKTNKPEAVEEVTKKSTALAAKTATAVAVAGMDDDFLAQFAGAGMEGADADSFAIPFLAVLQKTSPAADADAPEYIEGARPGMFLETVSRTLMDGKEGIHIVPCAYKREFIRWGSDDSGEGYKGAYTPEQVVSMREAGTVVELDNRLYFPLPDGSVSEKKCDRLSDTRNHYVLVLDGEGGWTRALMSLSSTQIKKSKHLMSALSNVKLRGTAGMYTPPTFANAVSAKTVLEQNDKGSWHGLAFSLADRALGLITRDIFDDAMAFCAEVRKGSVSANYDAAAQASGGGTSSTNEEKPDGF